MKKIIATIICILIFCLPVSANGDDIYDEQLELSGADEIQNYLSDDAKSVLDSLQIDINEKDLLSNLTFSNLFSVIFEFISTGGKKPLALGASLIALILVTGAFSSIKAQGEISTAVEIVCVGAIIINVLVPLFTVIQSTAAAIKAGSVFMLGFIPVFAGILTLEGSVTTASVASGTIIVACEIISYISAFIITPLVSAYLAVSACCTVSPLLDKTGLVDSVKRAALWIYGLASTIFLGLLTFQTTISGAADSMLLRTSKFVISSIVPVAGSALSEALSTLCGSVGVLKHTVGIYGAIAVFATVLPVCIELLFYKFSLFLASAVAQLFSQQRALSVIKAADGALTILVSVLSFTAVMFIICLTIVVKAGG